MGPALHGIILRGRTTLSARLGVFLVVRRGGGSLAHRRPLRMIGILQVLGDAGERVWAGQGEDGTV